MLKFFRKYNKMILVVGGSLLMVAFLVQGTLNQLVGPSAQVLGQIDAREVTSEDARAAAMQIQVLEQLPLVGQMMGQMVGRNEELKWYLILHDAHRMGLSASRAQIQGVLDTLGIGEREMSRLTQRARITPEMLRASVYSFIVAENYRELVLGLTHMTVIEKLRYLREGMAMLQQGNYAGLNLLGAVEGSPRLSEPLVAHYLQEQGATVAGQLVALSSDVYLDQVPAPDQATLQTLFDQYRDDLPGQPEADNPHGLGYRTPNRVQLQYLAIPMQAALPQVHVEEAQALAFYDEHQQEIDEAYPKVRELILTRLKQQKASALIERMLKTAQSKLFTQARTLAEEGGYRVLHEGFDPMTLRVVADELENEFDVRPQLFNFTQTWTAVSDLGTLPLLGGAQLANRPGVTLEQYVMSAREMGPSDDPAVSVLQPLRLQVGLASQPLVTSEGTRILLRLTQAQPTEVPQSLDAVRQDVSTDAKRVAAYRMLIDQRQRWLSQAQDAGLEALAKQADAAVIHFPATPRRQPGARGVLETASIPGIGASEPLVDALFATAREAQTDGSIAKASQAQRTGEVPLDATLSLVVYQLDTYRAMTQAEFDRQANLPWLVSRLNQTLLPDDSDGQAMSFDAIAHRVGFVRDGASEDELTLPQEPAVDAR